MLKSTKSQGISSTTEGYSKWDTEDDCLDQSWHGDDNDDDKDFDFRDSTQRQKFYENLEKNKKNHETKNNISSQIKTANEEENDDDDDDDHDAADQSQHHANEKEDGNKKKGKAQQVLDDYEKSLLRSADFYNENETEEVAASNQKPLPQLTNYDKFSATVPGAAVVVDDHDEHDHCSISTRRRKKKERKKKTKKEKDIDTNCSMVMMSKEKEEQHNPIEEDNKTRS